MGFFKDLKRAAIHSFVAGWTVERRTAQQISYFEHLASPQELPLVPANLMPAGLLEEADAVANCYCEKTEAEYEATNDPSPGVWPLPWEAIDIRASLRSPGLYYIIIDCRVLGPDCCAMYSAGMDCVAYSGAEHVHYYAAWGKPPQTLGGF